MNKKCAWCAREPVMPQWISVCSKKCFDERNSANKAKASSAIKKMHKRYSGAFRTRGSLLRIDKNQTEDRTRIRLLEEDISLIKERLNSLEDNKNE